MLAIFLRLLHLPLFCHVGHARVPVEGLEGVNRQAKRKICVGYSHRNR
jgi:hypothetical protein